MSVARPPVPSGRAAVRALRDDDVPALCRLFHDSVHRGAVAHYDARERAAWSPAVPDAARWRRRLAGQIGFVAECDGAIAGFMTASPDGRVDLAYVAPDRIGAGVAAALYDRLEAALRAQGARVLTTSASRMARGFFLRRGWAAVADDPVIRNGVRFDNLAMTKKL